MCRADARRAPPRPTRSRARWWRDGDGASRANPARPTSLAKDHLTGLAYRNVCDTDPIRLTVHPAAFILYLASLVADDPDERAQVAEIVGSNLVRESFFGIATQYTLDEAIQLADMMSQDGDSMSLDDARAAIQLNLLELLDDTAEVPDDRRVLAAGGAVLRRRSRRRDERAKRAEKRSEQRESDAKSRELQSRAELSAKDNVIDDLRHAIATKDETLDALTATKSSQQDRLTRLKRILIVIGIGTVLAATAAVLIATDVMNANLGVAACGAIYLASAIEFCADTNAPGWRFVTAAVLNAGWMAAGSLLG